MMRRDDVASVLQLVGAFYDPLIEQSDTAPATALAA